MSVSRSDPPELGPAVPGELAQACRKATHQDALQRHEDVASFRRAIADCLEHRGSIAVAQVARERLAELERASATTPPDAARVARVGAECRFGFLHALETWPANDDARRGLRACLGVLAAFEAEHGSPDAAQALCDELRALDPEAPDLAALAARVAERRAESESARRLAAELDPRVSREDRRRFLLLLIGLIAPALLALGLTTAAGLFDPTYAYIIGLPVIGFTLLVVLLFAGRRTLFRNDFNRRVSLSLVVFLASIILHRIVSARLGIPVPQILTNDLCLAALTAALSGLGLGIRRLFPVAAILAAGALVATREPTTPTPILIAVCGVAGVVLVEGLVRRPPAPRER